jgi:pimeloyl-ACP methyl ester carboxylesterase
VEPIPVVLVPGLLCSAEVWGPQIPALWEHGPVQIAATTRGSTMGELAEAVLAAAPPRFALAGVSLGGYLCFEILRRAPGRVERLALLDTSARPDTPEQTAGRHALLAHLSEGDFVRRATDALDQTLHPAHRGDPRLAAVNGRMAGAVGLDGLARQTAAAIGRPDSRPTLAGVVVPTLVLVGDTDPLTPPELSGEIAAGIAGAELVVVAECGHASTLEQPAAVTAALVAWLSG